MGYTRTKIIFKNDQEQAILEVQQKIMTGRTAETVPKNSEVGESQLNGGIKNGIKKYQEQFRTLKDNLEANTKLDISMKHATIPWLIEWTRGHSEQVRGAREWEDRLPEHRDEKMEEAGCSIRRESPLPAAQDREDEDGGRRTEDARRHMARSQDEKR